VNPPNDVIRQDIAKALRSGTVPANGLEHIAVGLDPQIGAIQELFEHASNGRSAYKFIRGAYGAGKTFLSTLACSKALEAGFLTSTVVISQTESPLYRLAQVYRKICLGLSTRSHTSGALQSVLDRWLYSLEERVLCFDGLEEDDPGFNAAVAQKVEQTLQPLGEKAGRLVACLRAYHQCQMEDDYAASRALLDWVSGEPKVASSVKRLAGITGKLDNTDALIFLKGLLELIRAAGHKGLVLVLDEVETISSQRRPERQKSLEVLRTLVDALDKNEFPGLVLLVTGTPDFFEGQNGVPSLEPLHDRLRVEFSDKRPDNLRMAQIRLRSFDSVRLLAVARRVKAIFPASNPDRIERQVDDTLIQDMVSTFTQGFGGEIAVVPRIFLREFLNILDLVDQHESYNPRTDYAFEPSQVAQSGLSAQEQEHLNQEAKAIYL
jgi:BREX system ATP-binding protein BrxC/D